MGFQTPPDRRAVVTVTTDGYETTQSFCGDLNFRSPLTHFHSPPYVCTHNKPTTKSKQSPQKATGSESNRNHHIQAVTSLRSQLQWGPATPPKKLSQKNWALPFWGMLT